MVSAIRQAVVDDDGPGAGRVIGNGADATGHAHMNEFLLKYMILKYHAGVVIGRHASRLNRARGDVRD